MAALFMRDASLTFEIVNPPGTAAEFNCSVHTVEVVPTAGDDVTYQTLCPDGGLTQKGASTYVLHVVGVQDWEASGLSRFLWDNAGQTAHFVAQAHGAATAISATAPGFEGDVVLVEGNYGGEADTWAEFDVELPCVSRPTLIETPPVAAATEAEPAPAAA